jgi:hypothetical protein|tara:strand:- start:14835 stop:15020 length:186 start_codon:yes stop_codon:yes gene_type:complete
MKTILGCAADMEDVTQQKSEKNSNVIVAWGFMAWLFQKVISHIIYSSRSNILTFLFVHHAR